MGSFPKSMKAAIFFIISSLFLVSATTQEGGFISVVVSRKGLDFTKDLLIEQAVSSIIPLKLPEIKKSIKIPLVGKVHIVLSNILIYNVEIGSSYVETGDSGIALIASGATANLSMDWKYTYSTWLFDISDSGDASIQVEGMEVGVTLALKDQEGTLKLSVLECGCYVKDITIKLDGGASWLYQGLVDAFKGQIISAVEDNISNKVREGIVKLDSLLQSLPKQIALDDIAALNVTFVGNPVLSNSSIEFQINGLFTALDDNSASSLYNKGSLDLVPCNAPAKMVEISLHENVFSSVSLVFYNENYMQRTINKIPDQSLLNTAQWKHIVPQLYKQYPDKDMELNISVSSPPIIRVANNGVDFTVYSDVTIGVVEDDDEVISVACISLEIHASCSPKISRNKLAGIVKLNDITASLKWSEIGNLHMRLVQAILSTILKTVVVPYLNLYLWKGLPLPLPRGFTLKNSEILSTNSRLRIFSDVEFVEG
ncbi:putative BPI/LBP family protein At1g04970 [Malus sylvestris]|uniref:putative BPI/LBP family protein At1g04970 n=1 Tax=Malus sylvestris TaxID=3752 RepID=UPI0021ABDE52|nr:putative BPI/LBP family protein At1g04970 [Malus sylvestris]